MEKKEIEEEKEIEEKEQTTTPKGDQEEKQPDTFEQGFLELDKLEHNDRYCIAGAFACVLSKLSDLKDMSNSFQQSLITTLCEKLSLTDKDLSSLLPIVLSPSSSASLDQYISPQPFLDQILEHKSDTQQLKSRIIIGLMNLFLAHLQGYDSRIRVILKALAQELGLDFWWFVQAENRYAAQLMNMLEEHDHSVQEETKRRSAQNQTTRWLKIGAAAVLGGGLLLVTGGLAAPAIAVGIGALGMTSTAVFLSTGVGVALVSSVFGATGAGLTGYKVNHVVEDIKEFEFHSISSLDSLNVVIAVNGILTKKEQMLDLYDCLIPLAPVSDIYNLRWETVCMLQVGNAISSFVTNQAVSTVVKQSLMHTAATTLLAAIAWPASLISLANIIDNPWSVAITHSDKAGLLLADALASRAQGHRPVSLVGYSFGARVIASALKELASRDDPELNGLIEDVYMLGTPFTADANTWGDFRSLVAGRLVNGYAKTDWVLSFTYRTAHQTNFVAGLCEIAVTGVENVDLSEIVEGHYDYLEKLDQVLQFVKFNARFGTEPVHE